MPTSKQLSQFKEFRKSLNRSEISARFASTVTYRPARWIMFYLLYVGLHRSISYLFGDVAVRLPIPFVWFFPQASLPMWDIGHVSLLWVATLGVICVLLAIHGISRRNAVEVWAAVINFLIFVAFVPWKTM
jgi:hypothetical protein